jgi:hypothetical protein
MGENFGTQPLETLLVELKLSAQDLVKSSGEQLTFKQVKKARAGVRLTPNIQHKVLNALNACVGEARFKLKDLFSY